MKLEVDYGFEKKIQPGVLALAGEDGQGPRVALKQVAPDLDLNENMIRRWVREFGVSRKMLFPDLAQWCLRWPRLHGCSERRPSSGWSATS
jgi:transposase-like protein